MEQVYSERVQVRVTLSVFKALQLLAFRRSTAERVVTISDLLRIAIEEFIERSGDSANA